MGGAVVREGGTIIVSPDENFQRFAPTTVRWSSGYNSCVTCRQRRFDSVRDHSMGGWSNGKTPGLQSGGDPRGASVPGSTPLIRARGPNGTTPARQAGNPIS